MTSSRECAAGAHESCWDWRCGCRCHDVDVLEPVRRTYDADELGIDQEDDD